MKILKYLCFCFFSILPFFSEAQLEKGDKGTLFLIIKQKDGKPVPYEEVSIVEKGSSEKSTNYTDKNGNVQFNILLGYVYSVSFAEATNYAEFAIPLNRGTMITSALVYNPTKKKNITKTDTIWQKPGTVVNNNNALVGIQLSNKKANLISDRKVVIHANGRPEYFASKTNANGYCEFILPVNMEFSVSVDKQNDLASINTHKQGASLIIKKTIPFDPNKLPVKSLNADNILADTITQVLTENDQPNAGESEVVIRTKNMKGSGVAEINIRLICTPIKKVFIAKTDPTGNARFIVPIDKMYWVGVDEYNDIDHVIVPKEDRMTIGFSFTYEPTLITETEKSDTITQELPVDIHATTARSYCHITIMDYNQEILPNEPVYLKTAHSSLVYKATTDASGQVDYLLPKGKKYYISFKYENNIDVLDVPNDKGFRKNSMEYTYRGSKNIEDYYAHSDRDQNGFFKRFLESKTTPIDIIDKQFVEKTGLGYNINLKSAAPVSTPALAGDEMITSEGYYSPSLYGFNTKNGHTDWGIHLAEGGASNTVYEDGVIIVNTESCTLYAIDSKTGKCLWSKWLSNYLYTTPSIADGKIYTIYANGLGITTGSQAFVLACFDLHKGDVIWQNWLDANALGAPVIDKNRVYVTTIQGKLCLFNAKDGKLLKEIYADATTNPLVISDKLYISTRTKDKIAREIVSIYNANTLAIIKKCDNLSTTYSGIDMMSYSTLVDMNYSGTRMISYKGKNYNVMGNKLLCTSPTDGSIIWSYNISEKGVDKNTGSANMPVVAGNKIVVSTSDGKIKIFDPSSGKMTKEYSSEGNFWTQPMVHNGWIYASTHEGKVVSIDTHDATLTGWDMWNYNPRHNTVIE